MLLETPATNYEQLVAQGKLLRLDEYDKIIVSYSGGKDSLALLLFIQSLGVPAEQIELWHQHVDGAPHEPHLMDWPCTVGYVKATAEAMGLNLRFQWKEGGFLGEMLRENAPTKGVYFEDAKGTARYCPPKKNGKPQTRRLFPQVSADLSVRWCSSYLKIDVGKRAINNDPRFRRANLLFLTGERRQESSARAKYNEVEEHGSNTQKRRVDQWRAIIDWTEEQVWDIIKAHRIRVHPAYYLGFGRVSCMACIFGDPNQWASVRSLAPQRFHRIAGYEKEFGKTIKQGLSIIDQANKGESFVETASEELRRLALSPEYPADQFYLKPDEVWEIPGGAYKRCGGPT